jgi:hypothetical protein
MEEKKCLKCGRPCPDGQTFCKECLTEMEKYPVKPGVVVLLPPKEQPRPPRRRQHPVNHMEEQLRALKKQVVALRILLILLLAAAGVLGWMAASDYLAEEQILLPGQNYSAETSEPAETE